MEDLKNNHRKGGYFKVTFMLISFYRTWLPPETRGSHNTFKSPFFSKLANSGSPVTSMAPRSLAKDAPKQSANESPPHRFNFCSGLYAFPWSFHDFYLGRVKNFGFKLPRRRFPELPQQDIEHFAKVYHTDKYLGIICDNRIFDILRARFVLKKGLQSVAIQDVS